MSLKYTHQRGLVKESTLESFVTIKQDYVFKALSTGAPQ
jgi:hypothetical protein